MIYIFIISECNSVNTFSLKECILQVSAATAQLLLACKVKADPNSSALRRYLCLYILILKYRCNPFKYSPELMIFFLCKEFLSYVRTQPFTLLLFSLENASNAVRRATENLVKAAQESIKNEDEDELTIDASDGSVKAQAKVSIFSQLGLRIMVHIQHSGLFSFGLKKC